MRHCKYMLSLFVVITLFVGILPTSIAWAQSSIDIKLGTVDTAQFPVLKLPLTVLNANGVPILELKEKNFEVLEDGSPLELAALTSSSTNPDLSLAVALVIDLSGSAAIDEIKAAAYRFLDHLGLNDRVALIGFNSPLEDFESIDPTKEVGFTNDLDKVRAVIDGLQAGGGSAIYESIYKGVLMTSEEVADRRAVIVMTDGFDDGSSRPTIATAETPKNAAKERRIPIFTIGAYAAGYSHDPNYLKVLARETGGRYQEAADTAKLADLFQNVVDQLRTQYELTVRTNTIEDGKDHTLKVRIVDTPQGTGEVDRTIKYPGRPVKPEVRQLQREVNGELQTIESGAEIKGRVLLVPQIVAENPIVLVEYRVDGELAKSVAVESGVGQFSPWEWQWSTCGIAEGDHTFEVTVYDNADIVSDPFELPVYALPPSATEWLIACLPDEKVGGIDLWIIIAIAAVLIFLGLFLFFTRRRQPQQPIYPPLQPLPTEPVQGPPTVTSPPQSIPPTQPYEVPVGGIPIQQPGAGYLQGTMQVSPSGYGAVSGEPVGSAAPPKTLMLKRKPEAMAWLIVERGVHAGKEFRLGEVASIGRTGENEIVLDDPSVSRQHAKVRLDEGNFTIFDLGATNTTKVNGQEIGKHQLIDGDRVEIGETTLVFKQVKISA